MPWGGIVFIMNAIPDAIGRFGLIVRVGGQWRVRNVPYPIDTYLITADVETHEIVIRTTNKKYFKVTALPLLVTA
jgi:hypothetical protein